MIKKADKLLIFILAAFAVILSLLIYYPRGGSLLGITVDGVPYGTYSLHDDHEITIDEIGKNIVVIKDNKVFMKESNCPDKVCVHHKAIDKSGETIVCLPNKVVLEILGGKQNETDSIAE